MCEVCDWLPESKEIMCVWRLAASRKQIVPEWPPVACKNSTRLAASRIQIVPEWRPVACKLPWILFMLHATGGHAGTIFACASGQLHANPPFFNSTMPEQLFE